MNLKIDGMIITSSYRDERLRLDMRRPITTIDSLCYSLSIHLVLLGVSLAEVL